MIAILIVGWLLNAAVFAATEISLLTVVGIVLALVSGVAGTYGLMAKQKDQAASVWRELAEAREAQNILQAKDIADLKARVAVLEGQWAREMAHLVIKIVEQERIEGRG